MEAPRVELGIGIARPRPGVVSPGLVIGMVTPGTPAEKAGLRPGDIIIKVDDKNVRSYDELLRILGTHKAGDKVVLRILRQGRERDISVTLAERREASGPLPPMPGRRMAFLGIATRPLMPPDRARLNVNVDAGLLVTDVLRDSPAAHAGVQRDDVLTRFEGEAVTDPGQLREDVNRAGVGKEVTLTIVRGKDTKSIKVKVGEAPGRRPGPSSD